LKKWKKEVTNWIKKLDKLSLAGILIAIVFFAYQESSNRTMQRILESQNDANRRIIMDALRGGEALLIRLQDGSYGVGFNRKPHTPINFTISVEAVVIRANGTVQRLTSKF